MTHRVAEAAASAQKRSAVRAEEERGGKSPRPGAEERLAGERKSARFRRAGEAEGEVGRLGSRAAAAELAEELAGERRRAAGAFRELRGEFEEGEAGRDEELAWAEGRARELEAELDGAREAKGRARKAAEQAAAQGGERRAGFASMMCRKTRRMESWYATCGSASICLERQGSWQGPRAGRGSSRRSWGGRGRSWTGRGRPRAGRSGWRSRPRRRAGRGGRGPPA